MQDSPYDRWLAFFNGRSGRELDVSCDAPFTDRPGREAVARSIERFELGESGDGANLKRLAGEMDEPAYARAIELFVAEEAQHAEWLGVLRERLGGQRLESHWSDHAFVALHHVGGLRREVCVLLTAEVIALTYYRVLPLAYEDPVLEAACARILRDERGHVAFHRAMLSQEFARMPGPARTGAVLTWRSFVAVTAKVVAYDHREVLALAGVTRAEFEDEVADRTKRLAAAVRSAGRVPEHAGAPAV